MFAAQAASARLLAPDLENAHFLQDYKLHVSWLSEYLSLMVICTFYFCQSFPLLTPYIVLIEVILESMIAALFLWKSKKKRKKCILK